MLSLVHTASVVEAEIEPDATGDFSLRAGTGLFFDAACGLLVISYGGSLYHIQLDGKATRWSRMPGGVQSWAGIGYHAARDRTALTTLYGSIVVVEIPSTNLLEPSTADYLGSRSFVMLPDRNLDYAAGRVWFGAPAEPMGVLEKTIRANPPNGTGDIICPAMSAPCYRWWCMSSGDGVCSLYNSTTKLVEKTVRIGAFANAGYSVKHDLFVAITAALELHVYVNDPEPAVLSAPVFDPPPRLGGVSALSAQLHSADGEPCAGYVVQFAVTEGTLDYDAAVTDATGEAKVQYRGPVSAAQNAIATATFDEA